MDTNVILVSLFLIAFVGVLAFEFVQGKRLRSSAKRLIREGDRLFVSGDLSAAIKKYEEVRELSKRVKKLSEEAADDKRLAELHLRRALLELAQNLDSKGIQPFFKDALDTFSEVNYSDFERLADQLQVPLGEEIYLAFRETELQYLRELLTSPEHLPNSSATICIGPGRSDPGLRAWAQRFGRPQVSVQMTERSTNGRLVIEVFMSVFQPEVWTKVYDKAFAFGSEGLKGLTDECIVTAIAGNKRVKSDIARQLVSDMAGVIEVIYDFVKGRRIMQEIDPVVIRETKYVPVYWYENLTGLLEGWPRETFRYRIHWWSHWVMVDCLTRTDLTEISNLRVLSADTLNTLWNVKEEQLRFEFVPASHLQQSSTTLIR